MTQPIFTLNARGNVMLEVIQDYFGLNRAQMHREISASFTTLLQILERKHVGYSGFKNALVPRPDRNEMALIFDTTRITSNWYGCEVFEHILPALDHDATHSFLCGDLIGDNNIQERLYQEFTRSVVFDKDCTWKHSKQFFIVYINNLSAQMLSKIRNGLLNYDGYVGWIDCYAPSFLKTYFAFTLCNAFLKAKRSIFQGHEDDVDNTQDVNMVGYPFSKYGYVCRSLQSMYYGLFLEYKIECGVYPGFELDTTFSLNAISNTVVPLADCEVEVEEAKLKYLHDQKNGSMKKSGLLVVTKKELEDKIRQRLASNYIFNMAYAPEHDTMKFNTVLNFTPEDSHRLVKLTASLKYLPSQKRLKLITMF